MRSYTNKLVTGSVTAALIVGLSACGSGKDEQQAASPTQSSARADVTATSTQNPSSTVTAVASGTATAEGTANADDSLHARGEVKEASPVVKKVVPVLPARKVKLPARKAPKVPATKPVGTQNPAAPTKPGSPDVPGEPAKPVDEPTHGETQTPQQPAPTEKPAEPTAPVTTSLPAEPTGPVVPTTPAQPEQPVSPDQARLDAVFTALKKTTASTTSMQMEFTDHLDKSGQVVTTDLFLDPSRERGKIVYPDGGLLEFININDRAYGRGNRAYWKRELGKEYSEEFYAEVDGKFLLTTRDGAGETLLADHLAGFQGSSNQEMRDFFDTVTVITYGGKPAWKLTGTGDPRLQLTVGAGPAHELLEFHGPSEPGAKDLVTMKYRMRNAVPAVTAPASDLVLDVRG